MVEYQSWVDRKDINLKHKENINYILKKKRKNGLR